MGYESKIIIANAHREREQDKKGKVLYAEIIAEFNLSHMGYGNGWRELFNKEIDFELFVESGDISTKTDKYGESMKEGNLEEIVRWLENEIERARNREEKIYRRIPPFLETLKSIDPSDWDEIHIVHYGY